MESPASRVTSTTRLPKKVGHNTKTANKRRFRSRKINEWIPQITGGKLDKSGVNWSHHQELRSIRNEYQAHPKQHLYGIPYSEICRRMNRFRTGIAGLLFDLHIAFNDLVPGQVVQACYMPDIQYVIDPK